MADDSDYYYFYAGNVNLNKYGVGWSTCRFRTVGITLLVSGIFTLLFTVGFDIMFAYVNPPGSDMILLTVHMLCVTITFFLFILTYKVGKSIGGNYVDLWRYSPMYIVILLGAVISSFMALGCAPGIYVILSRSDPQLKYLPPTYLPNYYLTQRIVLLNLFAYNSVGFLMSLFALVSSWCRFPVRRKIIYKNDNKLPRIDMITPSPGTWISVLLKQIAGVIMYVVTLPRSRDVSLAESFKGSRLKRGSVDVEKDSVELLSQYDYFEYDVIANISDGSYAPPNVALIPIDQNPQALNESRFGSMASSDYEVQFGTVGADEYRRVKVQGPTKRKRGKKKRRKKKNR